MKALIFKDASECPDSCTVCEKECPEKAIRIINDFKKIVFIDVSRCNQCLVCFDYCPLSNFTVSNQFRD